VKLILLFFFFGDFVSSVAPFPKSRDIYFLVGYLKCIYSLPILELIVTGLYSSDHPHPIIFLIFFLILIHNLIYASSFLNNGRRVH
jgi:hypothetical protein